MKAYAEDLAYIHHTGHGDYARKAAPGLLALLRRHGVTRGRIVDLGCGSGIWANELCERGYLVTGIDISPAMIRLARKNAPSAEFQVGSLFHATLPPCDGVTALGESFSYLFDTTASSSIGRLFQRIHAALRLGGVLIFDLAEPGRVPEGVQKTWSKGIDWAVLSEAVEDSGKRVLTRNITSFRAVGNSYRRSEERHRLMLHERNEILRLLKDAGFQSTEILAGYGRFRLPVGMTAFLAVRS